METLTLNNGVVLENSYAIENDNILFVYTQNSYSMKDIFDSLYDQNNTETITYNSNGNASVFSGFTKLTSVCDEGRGMITAILKKQ